MKMAEKRMTYKEFVAWINERACDGRWGSSLAIKCIMVHRIMDRTPFWRRRKKWAEICNDPALNPLDDIAATQKLIDEDNFKLSRFERPNCLFCSNSLSSNAPDGSEILVCFDKSGSEGREVIVDEDDSCVNFN